MRSSSRTLSPGLGVLEKAGASRPISQSGPKGLTLPTLGPAVPLTWDMGPCGFSFPLRTLVQSRLKPVAAKVQSVPLSSPNLPLLLCSGNANTFQYPPKANIIRKINQLEEPPKFNTFPIPLATDFDPFCRSGLPDVLFLGRGPCLWAQEPTRWEEEMELLFLDLQRPLQAGERGPNPHSHPRWGVRLGFLPCSCFPHKLDSGLGNNVASLII